VSTPRYDMFDSRCTIRIRVTSCLPSRYQILTTSTLLRLPILYVVPEGYWSDPENMKHKICTTVCINSRNSTATVTVVCVTGFAPAICAIWSWRTNGTTTRGIRVDWVMWWCWGAKRTGKSAEGATHKPRKRRVSRR
jgi:hypothetical protein